MFQSIKYYAFQSAEKLSLAQQYFGEEYGNGIGVVLAFVVGMAVLGLACLLVAAIFGAFN